MNRLDDTPYYNPNCLDVDRNTSDEWVELKKEDIEYDANSDIARLTSKPFRETWEDIKRSEEHYEKELDDLGEDLTVRQLRDAASWRKVEEDAKTIIHIPAVTQSMLMDLAKKRAKKYKTHAKNHRVDPNTNDVQMHYEGLLGEYAVSCYLGLELDDQTYDYGDDGCDMVYKGHDIQIKYNKRRWGQLYFNDLESFKTTFAILTVPYSSDSVKIIGFISNPRFKNTHYVKDFGYGNRVLVDQTKLTPMHRFDSAIKFLKNRKK